MSQDKFQSFLQIAAELKALADQMMACVDSVLQQPIPGFRWRVLLGLGFKALGCFEILCQLAAQKRSESIILLKTLVEVWFYLRYVAQDDSDQRAKLVLAKGVHEWIRFLEMNPDFLSPLGSLDEFKNTKDDLIQSLTSEWKDFKKKEIKQIAQCSGLADYYSEVYKLACDTAHIADIVEHIPFPASTKGLTPGPSVSAMAALAYGSKIIIDVLRNVSEFYSLGFEEQLVRIEHNLMALS